MKKKSAIQVAAKATVLRKPESGVAQSFANNSFSKDYARIRIGNEVFNLVNFSTREMPSGYYINIKYELIWLPLQMVFNIDVEGGDARSAIEKLRVILDPILEVS